MCSETDAKYLNNKKLETENLYFLEDAKRIVKEKNKLLLEDLQRRIEQNY